MNPNLYFQFLQNNINILSSPHFFQLSTTTGTSFALIIAAEIGDKNQLAVVAFNSTSYHYAVWIGATAALIFTSTLGVLAGRTLLKKIPLRLIHIISGIIFLCLAFIAGMSTFNRYISVSV
jgi:putative Ca2+/H+ antiporter (TMEM165/GDT1 family)